MKTHQIEQKSVQFHLIHTPKAMTLTRIRSIIMFTLIGGNLMGQVASQNFGSSVSSHTSSTGSTSFIPTPTSGATWARAGVSASISLLNSSNPLGTTGSFVRASASTSASVTKFSPWVGYTSGTEFYTSFKVLFGDASGGAGANSGVWKFYMGTGAMYSDASDFTGSQVFTGLNFTYGAGGSIGLTYRSGSTNSTTSLTTSTFSSGVVYKIEIIGNNKSTGTINYSYNGIANSVGVQKFDLYVNGTIIGNDLSEAQLPANTSINSGTFIGISSTLNSANIFVDDAIVYNSIPLNIGVSAPSSPTITGITPNNTQLSVDFNAPTSNGGVSITNYIYSTDNGLTWITPNPAVTSSPLVISNLSAGTSYSVQLKAINSVGSGAASNTVTATIPSIYTWTGTTSTNWSTSSNWNPTGIPDGSIDITIPNSATCTNSPEITSITINSGKTLTLQSGAKLSISGVLTNNGTVTIENGATLVQTGSGSNSGNGIYNVKQTITGTGGVTPNGRFWYLGSPLSNGSSTALLSSTGNQLWQWDETNANYATLSSGQSLTQGKSYVLRSGQTAETINFSGTGLSNGTLNVLNLTRTGTSAQMRGCHLVSNPYPSYLDWDLVGKTNVSTTMYVRTALGSNFNVLETYNSFDQIGTSISGTPMTKDIAPMQGFWVKVTADGQTGSLAMDNDMRSHQANGAGLRSSAQNFPAFLRMNVLDGENKDQVILFMSPDATSALDEHDSEKLPVTGSAQIYSIVDAKKLVINGMKNVKAKTSIPLILDLPSSKSYTFQAEEFNIEDGLILLEDKQEGVMQDLTINPIYSFFGNVGINTTRFVIHFHLRSAEFVTNDFETNELSANITDFSSQSSHINVLSNGKGQISVNFPIAEMKDAHLEVIDASGRTILKKKLIEKETIINLDNCSGIYYVRVSTYQNIELQKIFVQP